MQAGYFEGDIVEMPEEFVQGRAADFFLWPRATIPYVIDQDLRNQKLSGIIELTMRMLEDRTPLEFVPRKNEPDYIHIKSLDGCYSYVGRQGGKQVVSLGRGCLYQGTITHELMHAVGFFHEHSRPDRDNYIDVFLDNVKPGFKNQFDKLHIPQSRLITGFSYDSIMLYGSTSFAINRQSPTMLKKNGGQLEEVYKKNRTQLPSETPEQYYYDVVQLCARVNPSMTEDDRLRHLTRGLRPEVQEKMVIANPETCAAFLQILQRINQAALMSRASGLQPIGTHYTAGMQSWMQNIAPPVGIAPAAATMQPAPTCVATCAAAELRCPRETASRERDLKAIADSIGLLSDRLKSIEDEMRRPPNALATENFPRQRRASPMPDLPPHRPHSATVLATVSRWKERTCGAP
ncbi:hypothetical protein MTO96_041384 [Rhipicephalus appendiculatus]